MSESHKSIVNVRTKRATLFGRNRNIKKNLQRGSRNLNASRAGNTLRMKTREIILTGGLLVRKEGYVFIRNDSFGSKYRKKKVILEEGVLKIFDCPKFSTNGIKQGVSSARINAIAKRDSKVECMIDLVQIKSFAYQKRMGRHFELSWRPQKFKHISTKSKASLLSKVNRDSCSLNSRRMSRFSSISKAFTRSSKGSMKSNMNDQRKFSILNPLTWLSSQERKYFFKAQTGEEGDIWVQSILYELKNQACCIQEAIHGQEYVLLSSDLFHLDKLDKLHRQHVDLWALAKGKVSTKTKEAMEGFVLFLERKAVLTFQEFTDDSMKTQSMKDELQFWRDMLRNIAELTDLGGNTVESGLEELQILNEEEFHSNQESFFKDFPKFYPTSKILNSSSYNKMKDSPKKFPKEKNGISNGHIIELNDIVVLSHENHQRAVEVKNTFLSAIDIRITKEYQKQAKILANIDNQRDTQLQELCND